MNVIPFNVIGLPDPETLAGTFVIRPVSLDANAETGPMLDLRSAASPSAALTDSLMSIFPNDDMIAYLFPLQVRSGQKDLNPGLLIHTVSVEGACTLLSMSYDLNGNPVLTTSILPEEYLSKILTTYEGSTIADVSGVDNRLEFAQVFDANGFGAVRRLSNDLTHVPKERGNAIFETQHDIGIIADVCSFYMTRGLTLSEANGEDTAAAGAFPPFRLLWRPSTGFGLFAFSTVYALTNTSISFRNLNGNFRLDYNLNANRPPQSSQPPHN